MRRNSAKALSGFLCVLIIGCPEFSRGQQASDSSGPKQKDLIDVFFDVTHWNSLYKIRNTRKINFSLIPVPGSTVGGNEFIVSSINGAFYLGPRNLTNLSTVYFIPYTNFVSRIGFIITPNVWLSENKWNMTGDLRIIGNDLTTFGIGGNSSTRNQEQINHDYIRIYLTADRKIMGNFYAGLGYNFDDFYHVHEHWNNAYPSDFQKYGVGVGTRTTSSGISFNLLWDSRRNSINPEEGIYSFLQYRVNPYWMGSDYAWSSLYFDNRRYFSFSETRHEVFGVRAFYWGSFGQVPYLDLPGTALEQGARSGRGYVLARFIGKQMLYTEAEYRFDISANGLWGGVVFANAESLTELATNRFAYLLPAVGTGVRLKFNKRSRANITLDGAVGKNSLNWNLNLGEFF
jgi:hypothetical protein